MKATMDANGTIVLKPENGAEAFALRYWVQLNLIEVDDLTRNETHHWRSQGLMVCHVDVEAPE